MPLRKLKKEIEAELGNMAIDVKNVFGENRHGRHLQSKITATAKRLTQQIDDIIEEYTLEEKERPLPTPEPIVESIITDPFDTEDDKSEPALD